MPKYKLNHNIDEQTCLSHYLVHTHRFSSHSIESGLHCITLCILYYVRRKGWKLGSLRSRRLEARRRAKLGESKIATKLADKITIKRISILLKRDGHTYLRLFYGSNL